MTDLNKEAIDYLAAEIFARLKKQISEFVKESVKQSIADEALITQDDLDKLETDIGNEIDERIDKALDDFADGDEFSTSVEDVVRNMEVEVRFR